MRSGMLKVTSPEHGNVWVQCEKVTYVRDCFDDASGKISSLIAFTGGETLKCKEAASWIREQLCPPH